MGPIEKDWLLDCEPRTVQLEALSRSYRGLALRRHKDDESRTWSLPHAGRPARGWGHLLEMRLGKTPLLLNEFLLFQRDYGINKALVLAPNKYKHTWALEADRFGVGVPTHVYDGTKKGRREADKFIAGNTEGMIFVNYEALSKPDNAAVLSKWTSGHTLFAADESVVIKNRNSAMFKGAHELAKSCAAVRIMTGKPTPQGVHDLYSQLRIIRQLEGTNFYQFRNKFALMGGFKGKKVLGVKNEDKLHDLLGKCSFTARRVDWGTDLGLDNETVSLAMNDHQKRVYREMEDDFITWLTDNDSVSADQVITKHLKLQQISSGFVMDEFRKVWPLGEFANTPKFVDLRDRLDNYINGKTIIVFHFTPTGDNLAKALSDLNPAVIRGNQWMKSAGRNVDDEKWRFNNDPSCRVMIGQSQAIKYGHTLMGEPSDPCLTTAYFENSYSLDDRSQSEQRNQGEGQLAPIHIIDYCSSPVEGGVIQALQRKENIAARIMGYYQGNV